MFGQGSFGDASPVKRMILSGTYRGQSSRSIAWGASERVRWQQRLYLHASARPLVAVGEGERDMEAKVAEDLPVGQSDPQGVRLLQGPPPGHGDERLDLEA
eukprot:623434-Hanusia_phi.AAC.1